MYRIITISGEVGSGKSSLAKSINVILPKWERVNTGQMFRDFLTSKGKSIQEVSQLPDSIHEEFDQVQKGILLSHNNAIVEGRLSGWLAQDIPNIFKVYCFAPFDIRVQRYIQREGCSLDQSISEVKFRDERDVTKYQQVYNLTDYRDRKYYDYIADTSTKNPDQLANEILINMGKKSN